MSDKTPFCGKNLLHIRKVLEQHTGYRIHLVFTRARTGLVRSRTLAKRTIELRVSKLLRGAPHEVWKDIAHFIVHENGAETPNLDHWVREHVPRYIPRKKRSPTPNSQGRHYNLRSELDHVAKRFAIEERLPSIGWSKGRRHPRPRYVTLGTYHMQDHRILIHPLLDGSEVPTFVLHYIIFHELLHALFPPQKVGNRRQVHPKEWKALEQQFPEARLAQNWIKEHFGYEM